MKKFNWVALSVYLFTASNGWAASSDHSDNSQAVTRALPLSIGVSATGIESSTISSDSTHTAGSTASTTALSGSRRHVYTGLLAGSVEGGSFINNTITFYNGNENIRTILLGRALPESSSVDVPLERLVGEYKGDVYASGNSVIIHGVNPEDSEGGQPIVGLSGAMIAPSIGSTDARSISTSAAGVGGPSLSSDSIHAIRNIAYSAATIGSVEGLSNSGRTESSDARQIFIGGIVDRAVGGSITNYTVSFSGASDGVRALSSEDDSGEKRSGWGEAYIGGLIGTMTSSSLGRTVASTTTTSAAGAGGLISAPTTSTSTSDAAITGTITGTSTTSGATSTTAT